MVSFFKKYGHGALMGVFGIFYLVLFHYLENKPVYSYHVVHTVFDDKIPFCEVFVIPYYLWFVYVIGTVIYFIFKNKNKREYYQLSFNLMMGMTLFLIVSAVYPNVQQLRPTVFPRQNIFTSMVAALYRADTPTNILPSIHVFNSIAIHKAISSSECFRDKKAVRMGSLVLCILIILSTMFIKQHSVIDVFLGATLALFGCFFFYPEQVPEGERQVSWNTRSNGRKRFGM